VLPRVRADLRAARGRRATCSTSPPEGRAAVRTHDSYTCTLQAFDTALPTLYTCAYGLPSR
jgi:hypothetical protein